MSLTLLEAHREERAVARIKFIKENSKAWRKNGKKHREMRLAFRLTLREMSDLTGFSSSKLGAFEFWNPIQNRAVVEKSYALVFQITGLEVKALTEQLNA
ncbi:MAG: hypothetical protein JZU65_22660 [Chlorobium sp.]|nr:hypothetical protein [Chlorobium sp.]